MIIGGEKITETARILLDHIELNDTDDLVEIDEVMVIAIVHHGNPDSESSSGSLYYRCTSARYHIQLGLMDYAMNAVHNSKLKE